MSSVGWGSGATSYVYHPDGKVDYQPFTNGVTTRYGYDGRGMIQSVSHKNGAGQNLAYREYWRDDRDRILAWKRGVGGPNPMEDGRGDRYLYDAEGQLEMADYRALYPDSTTPQDPKRRDVFHYDQLGNRMGSANVIASWGSVAASFSRENNGLNQYVSWTKSPINQDDDMGSDWGSPGHANGVTMQEGWITASYNALKQPKAIWCPSYPGGALAQFMWFGFDPLGRCVKRWMGSETGHAAGSNPATYYYYDGWNLIQEGPGGSTADRTYVHGGRVDEIVASQAGGEWVYHHYDARGHCILLTNASNGTIREQYDYDAFGYPYFYSPSGGKLGSAFQFGNRFLFTGREWLKDLRVYDYRNRIYQPELGRFLQPDPTGFEGGDYNLYRYCHNDPVNSMDPTGLQDELLNKPNLTSTGQGDWMRAGSPFTNGELLSKVQNYVGAINHSVKTYVKKANKESRNVKWTANVSNWLRSPEHFKDPRDIAKTDWSTKSTAVMNAGTVASVNINLQVNINWNATKSAHFGNALKTDNMGRTTGEIEHPRDALKALSSWYGGAPPARDIANKQAASMVGQSIPEEEAAARMDDALRPWADATMVESNLARDQRSMEHKVLTLPMKTRAFSATLAIRIVFAVLVQLSMCYVIASDNGTTASPEETDKSFVRRFDFGRWATPFVDPDRPPVLELITLSWDRRRLMSGAVYHNQDSSEAKKVEGRQIALWVTAGPLFWPYASLEVSNEREGDWTVIGSSPPGTDGTETAVLMYPDKAAYVEHSAPTSPSCRVDLTPFREFIGKCQYGRVVLRSGGASQTIVLTDLLALEPSPTPAPTSDDSSTASE